MTATDDRLTDEQFIDRFDRYAALYVLCSEYHSGQWSRGYRLLSKIQHAGYRPGLRVQNGRLTEDEQVYYDRWLPLAHTL